MDNSNIYHETDKKKHSKTCNHLKEYSTLQKLKAFWVSAIQSHLLPDILSLFLSHLKLLPSLFSSSHALCSLVILSHPHPGSVKRILSRCLHIIKNLILYLNFQIQAQATEDRGLRDCGDELTNSSSAALPVQAHPQVLLWPVLPRNKRSEWLFWGSNCTFLKIILNHLCCCPLPKVLKFQV